ncbi:hypothetical protein B005_1113 [Nocardiopsis alba ATCC BAA-2165]|uniref:Uncharacterized protein n=1 Tax=Nocardiopsis alba (strain ATCC BAA-2165 / BE74) TaxID=1205910 RepID=J7LHB2_NOCAA|nr:hypothetical protein B005_1113 [Nocardiopsis alba ATCC BAA-2165]
MWPTSPTSGTTRTRRGISRRALIGGEETVSSWRPFPR